VSSSWLVRHLAECNTEKFIKKLRGEKDIEAALQSLDRLTLDEVRAAAAQILQVVNKAERALSPICNILVEDRGTEPDLQVTRCYRRSRDGFHLQIPGRITKLFMNLDIAEPERG
jgi:hypothetical protein